MQKKKAIEKYCKISKVPALNKYKFFFLYLGVGSPIIDSECCTTRVSRTFI